MMSEKIKLRELLDRTVETPVSTVEAELEQRIVEVARKAALEYVRLLVNTKKHSLKEQLDREGEMLTILQRIDGRLAKSNFDLERDVLLAIKQELAAGGMG